MDQSNIAIGSKQGLICLMFVEMGLSCWTSRARHSHCSGLVGAWVYPEVEEPVQTGVGCMPEQRQGGLHARAEAGRLHARARQATSVQVVVLHARAEAG